MLAFYFDRRCKIGEEQAVGKHILAEAGMADVAGYGGEGQCDTKHAGLYMFIRRGELQYFLKMYEKEKN